jgi:uracil-DNA glycosylase family 4
MTPDPERVARKVVKAAVTSEVFVIGQAPGPQTQRRSGVPYTYPSGVLNRGGHVLDGLLEPIGYTIDPRSARRYVYSSDIVQRYPGPAAGSGGDRLPTRREVENCLPWLEVELAIVRPRVILLLGAFAARHFLNWRGIVWSRQWGYPEEVTIDGHLATAFAVYHPAYRRRKPDLVDSVYASVAAEIERLLAAPVLTAPG